MDMIDEKVMYHTIKIIKPKKRMISFLKQILDENHIKNKLSSYLSTTSNYHIPIWN